MLAQASSIDGTWEKAESIITKASEKTCERTKGGRGRERVSRGGEVIVLRLYSTLINNDIKK